MVRVGGVGGGGDVEDKCVCYNLDVLTDYLSLKLLP